MYYAIRIWAVRLWRDTRAQDLIEYALLTASMALAFGASGLPQSAPLRLIFARVEKLVTYAANL